MEKRTTKTKRSWGTTIGFLVAGVLALGLSGILFITIVEGPITIGIALIPAILGIILIAISFGGSGVGRCPVCNASLSGLGTKTNDGVLCAGCNNYLEGKDGLIWQTDPNRIAERPLFSSPLPEQFNFPEGCNVCGSPEVDREKIVLRIQNASSALTATTVGVTTSTEVSVAVPCCSLHTGGALLTGTPKSTNIKFRSYPYLKAFCELNGTTPG